MKTLTWEAELTDTFGGSANYSWVRRESFDLPENATNRQIVRAGKAAVGLTGCRCRTENYGDTFALWPYGACAVLFITLSQS